MPNDRSNYSYETDVFKYNYKQLVTLRTTTLALASVSLISSVFIIVTYVYMLFRHKKKVNRVSLRCVFLCAFVDMLNSILNIASINKLGGTTYCKSASVMLITTNLLSASLLTIVGLNLVLIFVLKVSQADLLEKFYYPGALIYSIVGSIAPIYQEVTGVSDNVNQYSCWYYIYIQDRTYSVFSWMWFYGFLFFINVIAIICSVIAMVKLLHKHRVFDRSMGRITNTLSSSKQSNERVKQNQSNMFTKVVLRCIIYPLVPFLANIFGFILQMVITTSDQNPTFYLAMLDIIFSCIEGFFVAIVFFTDPAVTSIFKRNFGNLCEKYVHQYTLVDTNTYDNTQRQSLSYHQYQDQYLSVSTTIGCCNTADDQSSFEKMAGKNQQQKKRMPVRCMKVGLNSNKTMHDDSNSKSELSVATHVNPTHSDTTLEPLAPHSEYKYIYIPYTYPRRATCYYWFFRCLGVKPKPIIKEENAGSFSSIKSSNINMPLVSKPKNVVLPDTV